MLHQSVYTQIAHEVVREAAQDTTREVAWDENGDNVETEVAMCIFTWQTLKFWILVAVSIVLLVCPCFFFLYTHCMPVHYFCKC